MINALAAAPAPRASTLNNLDHLRAEIDDIDEALLELIERRLAKAAAIAEVKSAETPGRLRLRPEREQEVLDRLARRTAELPGGAVRGIWRELMGLSLQSQKRTELVICAPGRPIAVTDGARLRFGCQAPLIVTESPAEALHLARTREAVAVIELNPLSNWWVALLGVDDLVIFDQIEDSEGRITALLVGRVDSSERGGAPAYQIVPEAALRRRLADGERLRTLAMAGSLRLCAPARAKVAALELVQ
jgi:chorismate mutase